jgi:hypothetical protein
VKGVGRERTLLAANDIVRTTWEDAVLQCAEMVWVIKSQSEGSQRQRSLVGEARMGKGRNAHRIIGKEKARLEKHEETMKKLTEMKAEAEAMQDWTEVMVFCHGTPEHQPPVGMPDLFLAEKMKAGKVSGKRHVRVHYAANTNSTSLVNGELLH